LLNDYMIDCNSV